MWEEIETLEHLKIDAEPHDDAVNKSSEYHMFKITFQSLTLAVSYIENLLLLRRRPARGGGRAWRCIKRSLDRCVR